jgi:hypothetical protein
MKLKKITCDKAGQAGRTARRQRGCYCFREGTRRAGWQALEPHPYALAVLVKLLIAPASSS